MSRMWVFWAWVGAGRRAAVARTVAMRAAEAAAVPAFLAVRAANRGRPFSAVRRGRPAPQGAGQRRRKDRSALQANPLFRR